MADDNKLEFRDADGKTYKAVPVGVRENDVHAYDVTLEDGTILRMRAILLSVVKVEGFLDTAGQPVYQVNAMVVPMVKKGPDK